MKVGDLVMYKFSCDTPDQTRGVGIITAVGRDWKAIQPRACDNAVDLYFVRWVSVEYPSRWTHPTRLVVINEGG